MPTNDREYMREYMRRYRAAHPEYREAGRRRYRNWYAARASSTEFRARRVAAGRARRARRKAEGA